MDKKLASGSFQRINVIGTSGCGKSTFSKKLAERIGVPYVEIDKVYWGPDWTEPADDVFFKKLGQALAKDKWVLDGNYTRTTHIKWKDVQVVIWLDYSFPLIFSRAVRRAVWRVATGVELWEGTGNKESLKMLFSKDSIVLWTWNTYHSNKVKYNKMMTDKNFAHIRFVRLSRPGEARKFLEEMTI